MNLLNLVKDQLTNQVTSKIASAIGVDDSLTNSALDSFLPGLLGGIVDKGSTEKGAGALINAISDNGLGENFLGSLLSNLGGGQATNDFTKMGGGLLSTIFGNRENKLLDLLVSATGVKKAGSSALLKMLAPIAMSVIGNLVKKNGLDALGLMKLLTGQRKNVFDAMPLGLAGMYGGESDREHRSTATTTYDDDRSASGGGGWWKWLLPLLLLLLLAWWLMRNCNKDKADKDVNTTEDVDTHDSDANDDTDATYGDDDSSSSDADGSENTVVIRALSVDADGNLVDADGNIIASKDGYSIDANGNIVDADGKILVKAGSFSGSISGTSYTSLPVLTLDADGNLVDADGKIVAKAGEFEEKDGYYVDKDGNRIGLFGKIGKAIGAAADATAGAFDKVFTDLFTTKEKIGSAYGLSDISWDPKEHTIETYSKAEVEALARVLTQYPDAKLRVEVGGSEAKTVLNKRANVVHDMLVALGVADKQISFKGVKGGADKTSIVVEQTVK